MEDTRSNLKLVMLDCDGVLFDSIRSNVAYYDAILKEMGDPPLNEEARRLCHVYSTPQLFAHFYADDPEKAKEAERIAYSIDYLPFLEYMDPEPGLYEVLTRLKASYKVALATNRGKSVPPLLERFELEGLFDVVSTILDVQTPEARTRYAALLPGEDRPCPGRSGVCGRHGKRPDRCRGRRDSLHPDGQQHLTPYADPSSGGVAGVFGEVRKAKEGLNQRLCRFQQEFVPVPRPKAGARARARFNNAKEAKKKADNEELEPIGSPNEDKNAWKSCHERRRRSHSNAIEHPCFGHGHGHAHGHERGA